MTVIRNWRVNHNRDSLTFAFSLPVCDTWVDGCALSVCGAQCESEVEIEDESVFSA